MATQTQIDDLRVKLGEIIPSGGTESDTMFTNAQISSWIDSTSNIATAAVEGWEAKLAQWASLVTVIDGAAARELSDLMDHGELMLKYYTRKALGPARTRSRVGKIIRS